MSLILEALRKSEAERRRAQMPDLLTEPQVAAPVAPRTPQRWPWLAAGAVVVLGAVWFVSRDATPVEAKATPVVVAAETRDASTVDASPTQATPTPARAEPATARPAPPPVQRPLVIAPPAPPSARTIAAAAPPVVPAKTDIPSPSRPPLESRSDVVAAPAPAPVVDTTERVTDLGNDERKQLPPLKLSMHMWNDAAAQRFVIIDGTRLGVGDHLGVVVVADILPDGVLLDWNGRPLKLTLR